MKVKELVKLIQEDDAAEIEFEDYWGNTICLLEDLDYADTDECEKGAVIRLQLCEKPGFMSPLKSRGEK